MTDNRLRRGDLVPKACSRCREVKDEAEFAPSVWRRNSGACRACQSVVEAARGPRPVREVESIACSRCKKSLDKASFTPSVWSRGSGYCKACSNAYYGCQSSENNRKRLYEYAKVRRRKRVDFVTAEKARRGCLFCGEKHPAALDFHHRDRTQKHDNIRSMCDKQRTEAAIQAEMDKCDVMCSNCHRKLHWSEATTCYWGVEDRDGEVAQRESTEMVLSRLARYPVELPIQ